MGPDDDMALLAAVGRGDQAALRTLYTAYRPRLWRYLSQQLGGHPELVEETLQDVFVAVWRAAGNFRGEARVATWLYRLAHNHAANARRGAARHGASRTVALSARAGESGEHPTYVRPAHDDEVAERLALQGALRALAPIHREALELVFLHGFSCDEAGRILGVPAGTVKSRLNHARRAFASHLTDPPEAPGLFPKEARADA